jgi:hypothetical protein
MLLYIRMHAMKISDTIKKLRSKQVSSMYKEKKLKKLLVQAP